MNELKWIQTPLLLTALLQFAAAAAGDKEVTFRVGENATLSCETVIQDQQECKYTTWIFFDSGNNAAIELVTLGQVRNSGAKSDRLRVTEDCSLVIKKIREEDAGSYVCQQYISGGRTGDDSLVLLSVTKSEDAKPEPIRPPITTTTTTTTTTTIPAPAGDWRWWLIFVPVVVFIVLLVVVVKVIRRKRNRTQMSDDVELTSDPAGSRSAAGTGQDMADPEGGVSYASIRYNKKGKREARVCAKDDANDGSVTYASVKASSSSTAAGASADPSILYATINKEKQ
ncbi:uncharacterized protein [Labrus bergylta]|uniref:uncharacterized protein n=1 Tax=Labrus bergylta TaxID=56723 RepID=UPI00331349AB